VTMFTGPASDEGAIYYIARRPGVAAVMEKLRDRKRVFARGACGGGRKRGRGTILRTK